MVLTDLPQNIPVSAPELNDELSTIMKKVSTECYTETDYKLLII